MGQSMKRQIGRILLDGGFLHLHELDRALEEQRNTKELLGEVLVRMGVLKANDVKLPLIIQEHLGTIDDAVKIVAGERQLLGALLVESGHITAEQLDNVLAEQKSSGEKLGEVFIRLGMLTDRQLNALLDFQLNQESAQYSPLRLGELLVATGHITREHLEEALHHQSTSNKKLGDILVEAGHAHPNHIEEGIHLQKMLKKAVLSAILSLGMSTESGIVGTAYAETDEMCLFSKQLQSSPMRERFIAKVATDSSTLVAYNSSNDNEVQSDASNDLSSPGYFYEEKSTLLNQGDTLDSYSRDCLSCHDGFVAHDVNINYRNTPGNKIKAFDVAKDHPVGMNYASYIAMDSHNYKPVSAFNTKMIFVNGRVGCLTCHNPLNPEKSHMVMNDYRSALCLTCHKK